LERFLRVLNREDAGVRKKKKFALTKFVLNEMFAWFDLNDYVDVMIWAALCIAVACLLRLSEFCVAKGKAWKEKMLKKKDLEIAHWKGREVGRLQLHDTKTKMFSSDNKVSFFRDNTASCPLQAIERWGEWGWEEGESGEDPLFAMPMGEALTFRTLDSKVRGVLGELGYDMELSRGWGPRGGGAMTLARAGVSDRVIRGMGRWRSWCYRMYLELQEEEKEVAAALVASASKKVQNEGETVEEVCERIASWTLRDAWVGRRSD